MRVWGEYPPGYFDHIEEDRKGTAYVISTSGHGKRYDGRTTIYDWDGNLIPTEMSLRTYRNLHLMAIASYLPDHIRQAPWPDVNPEQPKWRSRNLAESQLKLGIEIICGRFFTGIDSDDAEQWIHRDFRNRGDLHDWLCFHAKIQEGNNQKSFSDRTRTDNLADGISRINYSVERDEFYERWKMCGTYRGCRSSERAHRGIGPDYLLGGMEYSKWERIVTSRLPLPRQKSPWWCLCN